jgi:hypothetical protein
MSHVGFLSEKVGAYIGFNPLAAGTTTAATGGVLDLSAFNADSVLMLGAIGNSTGGGASFTLQGSASTASFATLCTSGTTVAITVATTVSNRLVMADAKCVPFRYVTVLSNTTAAVPLFAVLIPYDSKGGIVTQSTANVAHHIKAVAPTTTA